MNNKQSSTENDCSPQDGGSQKTTSSDKETGERSVSIPWGVYFTAYFIQGILMQLLLGNISVFLRKALNLDWLVLTTSFFIMAVPVVLRPLFAFIADKWPAKLSSLFVFGLLMVTAGTMVAGFGTLSNIGGLGFIVAGFSVGIVGATILNVVADSHIVRFISLDKSAKVNSSRRIFAFLGVFVAQLGYILIVGKNLGDLRAWGLYFMLPTISVAISFIIISFKEKSPQLLPTAQDLPTPPAQWLINNPPQNKTQHPRWLPIIFLFLILLLFNLPDGLIEAPWEIFIVEKYGTEAWVTYSGLIIFGGFVAGAGFILARRSGKRPPEWDFLWFAPIITAYYALLLFIPPFEVLMGITICLQSVVGFIQVRILQAMQGHSYFRRAGLTFQIFMITYQGGKFLGIGLSGVAMTYSGYLGLFLALW